MLSTEWMRIVKSWVIKCVVWCDILLSSMKRKNIAACGHHCAYGNRHSYERTLSLYLLFTILNSFVCQQCIMLITIIPWKLVFMSIFWAFLTVLFIDHSQYACLVHKRLWFFKLELIKSKEKTWKHFERIVWNWKWMDVFPVFFWVGTDFIVQ